MIAIEVWQSLLNGFGWTLAQIYDLVPNYALAIILLTLLIRLILLPFGFKQIKSMQHMQALQPELTALKKKYKNNKQKIQEEQMRLYREAGVSPLGGCLPLLLTLPFLFAMYAIIRPPSLEPTTTASGTSAYVVVNNHLPEDSALFERVVTHTGLEFATANLQCSLSNAGTQVPLKDTHGQPLPDGSTILGSGAQPLPFNAVTQSTLDCGTSRFPAAIPYVVLLGLMLASAIYQQRQMTKANPQAAQAGPQAAMMKYMPLIYVVWGWQFPAGLVMYWTTANGIQIAQQTVMLKAGHIGPDALERRKADLQKRLAEGGPQKKGFMAWMSEKADAARQDPGRKPTPTQNGPKAQPKPKPTGAQKKPGGAAKQNAKPVKGKPKGAKPGNQLRPKRDS
jgi:YidC/Oxa1 family membrane protein insertase